MADKIRFIADNTWANQDWTKARSFDFPLESKQQIEAMFGLTSDPAERLLALRHLAKLPISQSAPDWLKVEIQSVIQQDSQRMTQPNGSTRRGNTAKQNMVGGVLAKILGKPIGGQSDFDGDGDGFVTGPTGEDNVPAPVAALKPNVSVLPTPKPESTGETPSTPAKQLKAILDKIGSRRKPFRMIDADDEGLPVEKIVMRDAQALIKGELPPAELVRRRDDLAAKIRFWFPDRYSGALSPEQIEALAKERDEAQREFDAADAKLDQIMRNSPLLRLWAANTGSGFPNLIQGNTRDQVLKALLVTQMADDMRKLGITDEDARHVIDRLGAIVKRSAERNQRNHKERFGDEISPVTLLADELVKQWARTANDSAQPSLVSQIIARQLMPQLHGLGDGFVQHEQVFKTADERRAFAEAMRIAEDPIVKKAVTAALQAQWARTQEQLARFAPDGKVTVYRGFGNEAAHREVVDQLIARGDWQFDDLGTRLKDKVNDAEGIIDAAEEIRKEQENLVEAANDFKKEMDDRIAEAQELIDELVDIDDSTDERASEIRDELEELQTRYERARDNYERALESIDGNQERIYQLVSAWRDTQAEIDEIQSAAQELIDDDPPVENAPAKLSVQGLPLASYATTQRVAANFARKDGGVLIKADVPATAVLSTACTGFGCFTEDEFVVSHPLLRNALAATPAVDEEELSAYSDEWGDIQGQELYNYVEVDSFDLEDPPEFPDYD